jgi:hypothetical protein
LPGKGHITLGQIAQRLNVLVIHCDRCRRREQYALWKLIVKFGTEYIFPSLTKIRKEVPPKHLGASGLIGHAGRCREGIPKEHIRRPVG